MQCEVARARTEGLLLSKYQRDRTWQRGELSVKEGPDPELHRVVRIAHLRGPGSVDIVPPLHDVQLIELRAGWWTLTGYERIEGSVPGQMVCFQQSWFLVPVSTAR